MNEKLKTSLENIKNDLLNLSENEFNELIEKHKNGDYAKIIEKTIIDAFPEND